MRTWADHVDAKTEEEDKRTENDRNDDASRRDLDVQTHPFYLDIRL